MFENVFYLISVVLRSLVKKNNLRFDENESMYQQKNTLKFSNQKYFFKVNSNVLKKIIKILKIYETIFLLPTDFSNKNFF